MSHGTRVALFELASWLLAGVTVAFSIFYFEDLKAMTASLAGMEIPDQAETRLASAQTEPPEAPSKSTTGGYRVELPAGRNGHFYAQVRVNGRPIDVLVDTGASLVSLSHDDAERAGIFLTPADYKYRANTANGVANFAMVNLSRVEIDGIVAYNVRAGVAEPGNQNITLLGMSFLKQLRRVEMQNGRLVLEN